MKSSFFCLILVYCALQASCLSNDVSDDSEVINELKTSVRSIIKELNLYQKIFESDLKVNLKRIQEESSIKIGSDLRYVINSVKTAVAAIGSTGKNAESCYKACEASLKKLNRKTNNKLNKCYFTFSLYSEPVMKGIQTIIEKGENLSSDLDYITIGCLKQIATGNCLPEKIQEVRNTLRNMQVSVDTIKNTGSSAMNKAKTVVTSCSEKAVRALHQEATFNIQRQANICVRNIYNDKTD